MDVQEGQAGAKDALDLFVEKNVPNAQRGLPQQSAHIEWAGDVFTQTCAARVVQLAGHSFHNLRVVSSNPARVTSRFFF